MVLQKELFWSQERTKGKGTFDKLMYRLIYSIKDLS